MEESLFWSDQIAQDILTRKRMTYIDKPVPSLDKYTVKTSASLSGVLHIGRLSDTIRGEAVFRSLKEKGVKAELIWVAEDMDPLRKVPAGVPDSYKKYIGMPVTDILDPQGCHESYAKHHVSEYFSVLDQFVATPMKKFSMREEYQKGTFRPYIQKILEHATEIAAIQNKYRSHPLKAGWSPWTPVCDNCGKIITPRITGFEKGKVRYTCSDYQFEETTALGCGYEGENDPLKGNGKLMWKSEWASQWTHWKIVSEGAGKEYQVPQSAWWVNGEIVENIFGFPMPVPIFYEHLMIDGEKMSASKGNIIYPKDWLQVAPAELLRFFYYKRLMKTRSFSWNFLPNLYDEYHHAQKVYFGEISLPNKREETHVKRLFEMSQKGKPQKHETVPFDFAVSVSQTTSDFGEALKSFVATGHVKTGEDVYLKQLFSYAQKWGKLYAPAQMRLTPQEHLSSTLLKKLSTQQKAALKDLRDYLSKNITTDEMNAFFRDAAKKHSLSPKEFFEAVYLVLLGKPQGPKLAPFLLSMGREKAAKLLDQIR